MTRLHEIVRATNGKRYRVEHLEECPRVNRDSLLSGCYCRPLGTRRAVEVKEPIPARFVAWLRSLKGVDL